MTARRAYEDAAHGAASRKEQFRESAFRTFRITKFRRVGYACNRLGDKFAARVLYAGLRERDGDRGRRTAVAKQTQCSTARCGLSDVLPESKNQFLKALASLSDSEARAS
jgi:hypothetical protein